MALPARLPLRLSRGLRRARTRRSRVLLEELSLRLAAAGGARERLGGVQHRAAGVVGLEHHRVACLLQDLARQPAFAGVEERDDHRTVRELLDHAPVLAGPACSLRGYPDACRARGLDL